MNKKCFIMGHRDAPEKIFAELFNCIEKHIECDSIGEFIVGNNGAFDRMAANAVSLAKSKNPNIKLTMLLPYHPAEKKLDISKCFDESWYPEGIENVPYRIRIVAANHKAVDESDIIILYCRYAGSNTEKIAEYARKKGKFVIML